MAVMTLRRYDRKVTKNDIPSFTIIFGFTQLEKYQERTCAYWVLQEFLCVYELGCPQECTCLYDEFTPRLSSFFHLLCVDKGLPSVPHDASNTTSILGFSGNRLPYIISTTFSKFSGRSSQLIELDISNCSVVSIQHDAFKGR